MPSEVIYVLACLSLLAAPGFPTCWTPRVEDVDWSRMSQKWHAVIDVPTTLVPDGCWNAVNFTETNNGVIWAVADETEKDFVSLTEYFYFTRKSPGVYLMNKFNAEGFSATFHMDRLDISKDEEKDIQKEIHDLVESEWIFLTDYDNYLMFVHCIGSDWGALVKTRTPQITVDKLQMISQALVDNGLHSPTMVLKNECLNTGDKDWNPADVVIY